MLERNTERLGQTGRAEHHERNFRFSNAVVASGKKLHQRTRRPLQLLSVRIQHDRVDRDGLQNAVQLFH